MPRIHVFGAAGAGSTTLGGALARRLGVPHIDADQVFWLPTDPPFTRRRPRRDRLAMLARDLPPTGDWIFSGAAISWAAPLEPAYDLIVFLRLDPATRLARLRARETERYGARIAPGGDMAETSAAFFLWAETYDSTASVRRGLAAHEAWLAHQTAAVLRCDSAAGVDALVTAVLAHPVCATAIAPAQARPPR